MAQALINLGEHESRVLTILKGKFGMRNKSEVINFVIDEYEKYFLEPELKPEYADKLKTQEKKGRFKAFKNVDELRKVIEDA